MIPLLRYDRRSRRYRREVMGPAWERALLEFVLSRQQSRWGRKMSALELTGDPLAMANPNNAPGMHSGLMAGFGRFAPGADVQVFVPQVCAQSLPAGTPGSYLQSTWTKPNGCQMVLVTLQGAGGGGGSGRKGSTSTVCCGGGGGGGGNFSQFMFRAADLWDEVPLTVGTGLTGGAAVSTNDTSGNIGGANGPGAETYFGTSTASSSPKPPLPLLSATCGGGGSGGTATSGSGAAAGAFGDGGMVYGASGGSANTGGGVGGSGAATAASGTNAALLCATGGGAGGGLTGANAHAAGSAPGNAFAFSFYFNPGTLGAAGAAGGGNGANGANSLLVEMLGLAVPYSPLGSSLPSDRALCPGSGGGGGGSANTADAVSGGNGGNGLWGGGGGGGGAATDTTSPQSGAGGNGGDGYIIVASW